MTATLSIPGLNCSACAQAVRTVLSNTPAIRSVNVDIAGKTVLLDFDPGGIDLAEIERRLADADFPVDSSEVG
jgi:copper chaperone CopZ